MRTSKLMNLEINLLQYNLEPPTIQKSSKSSTRCHVAKGSTKEDCITFCNGVLVFANWPPSFDEPQHRVRGFQKRLLRIYRA